MQELGQVISRTIHIEGSGNKGFIVNIGCGRFVFETKEGLLEGMREYLDAPKEMEKKYNRLCGGNPQEVQAEGPATRGQVDRPEPSEGAER